MQALSFSDDAQVSGPVVFAGYGLVLPASHALGYDSYAALDVKDKTCWSSTTSRKTPTLRPRRRSPAIRTFATKRSRPVSAGAKGLLIVTGPRSPNAGQTLRMSFDTALSGSGIPAASISEVAANALFAGATKSLAAAQQELDSGNPHVSGFALPATVDLTMKVVREKQTARNVVAYLPASGPTPPSTNHG